MSKLFNLARMSSATTGTGTATLGAAISGYLTFALAGVANGDIVTYGIKDGANSEVGYGLYTSAGTTLTRNVLQSTNGNALISLSGAAEIYITAQASDFPFPDNWLTGLTLVNNGTTSLDVLKGAAADSLNIDILRLAATLTKSISSNWVVGSTNGGLDTGAVAASTWYHVWLIRRQDTGVVDALFSLSATAPTMPGSYTQKRRIGSIKTDGSSLIIAFFQRGDKFLLATPVSEFNAVNPGITAVTRTLAAVPTGIKVDALLTAALFHDTITSAAYISSLDVLDTATNPNTSFTIDVSGAIDSQGLVSTGSQVTVGTNTSAQIRTRLSVSVAVTSLRCSTLGWLDPRGMDG